MVSISVEHTKGKYWGGTQLSFTLFKWITILFGAFGLEQLLIRSPTTAAIKVIGNILTLGYFYFYDVLQVTVEEESVIKNGLCMPFLGHIGTGQGMFNQPGEKSAPDTSPKPYLFAVYCITVLFGFGLDFLIAGDFVGAAVKIFSIFPLILFPFTPIFWLFTLLWWGFTILRTYVYTDFVLSLDNANKKRGIAHFFTFYPFSLFNSPYYIPDGKFIPKEVRTDDEPCNRPLEFPWNMISVFYTAPVKLAVESIKSIVDSAVTPVTSMIGTTTQAYASAAQATVDAVKVASEATGKSITAASELAGKAPQIAAAAEKLMHMQKGGSNNKDSPLLLLGFLALIVGGSSLTIFRAIKNGYSNPDPDDRPPESRTARKSFL